MNISTLGVRGTEVVLAGLKCGSRFSRDELVEQYGRLRRDRGDVLPQHWSQGVSNQIQRISSDFAQYDPTKPDLLARRGPGLYCFRDNVLPKLVAAANASSFETVNTLTVPFEGVPIRATLWPHEIGRYAQNLLMREIVRRGYEILEDTSQGHAYDFTFRQRNNRTAPVQYMECKGTTSSENDFTLTPNEQEMLCKCYPSYWIGSVTDIKTTSDRRATGGTILITPPPVHDRYHFGRSVTMRLIVPALPDLFGGQ